jgi:hypothetical protein
MQPQQRGGCLGCRIFLGWMLPGKWRVADLAQATWMQDIPRLDVTPPIEPLAEAIVKLLRLPTKAVMDAFHVSFCIVHQMDYLLTWNCTHLANPVLQKELVEYCRYHDLHIPIICTPQSLLPSQL